MNLPDNELVFDPMVPAPVIALIGGLLLFFTIRVYWRVGSSAGRWRNLALLLFRLAGVALVLLLLLQPSRHEMLPPPARDRVTLIGLDTSLSMKQRDAGNQTRFDAAKNLLLESGAVAQNGVADEARVHLFEFSDDARAFSQ